MKSKAIFVGGVHGVGKTTFIMQLNQKMKLPYFSAGKLIKEFMNDSTSNKEVRNLNLNQNILIESIKKKQIVTETYLLDGHFCILDSNLKIQEVPIEVFKNLNIKEIFLLIADPVVIQKRLKKRDKKDYSLELIKDLQDNEKLVCKKYCKQLNIKLTVIE